MLLRTWVDCHPPSPETTTTKYKVFTTNPQPDFDVIDYLDYLIYVIDDSFGGDTAAIQATTIAILEKIFVTCKDDIWNENRIYKLLATAIILAVKFTQDTMPKTSWLAHQYGFVSLHHFIDSEHYMFFELLDSCVPLLMRNVNIDDDDETSRNGQ
jgi:hypothetical protein